MDTATPYLQGHVVVVGYTRLGRALSNELKLRETPHVIVDTSRDLVAQLRNAGQAAIAGEYTEAETLVQAHVATADHLLIAIESATILQVLIEHAVALNPRVAIYVHAKSQDEGTILGATRQVRVYQSESSICASMLRDMTKTETTIT